MNLSLPALEISGELARILGRASGNRAEVAGPWGSGKTLTALLAAEAIDAPLLLVTCGRLEAEGVYDDLCTFAGEENVVLLPAWEVLPSDAMNPADDIVAERMNALKRLAAARESGEKVHAVLPVRSFMQYVIRRKRLTSDTITLRTGEECVLEDLLEKLIKLGYEREVMVEERGEVSVRGGIVDIFPISSELPCRLEFFGDAIDSIRIFEPETQRSVAAVDEIRILPRSEKNLLARKGDALASVFDYLPKNTLVVLDEAARIREEAEKLSEQIAESPWYMAWTGAEEAMKKYPVLSLSQVAAGHAEETPRFRVPMQAVTGFQHLPGGFWDQLEEWDRDGYAVRLICVNTGERKRLHDLLEEHGYRPGSGRFDLSVHLGRLHGGFASAKDRLAVISEREIFGKHYVRRKRRRFEAGMRITQFSDLKTGDYVVHAVHGIGRYLGLRRFEGKAGDFMAIQYGGGDTAYVPVHHIDHVQKFTGGEGAMPKIDKLGGQSWARKKARVKKAVREMMQDLIQLYAVREHRRGHAFNADTPWQQQFEDAFEYEETPDQKRAIQDVKRDMETNRPMDRLLCGDVGFGKTEVALRAVFKCVMDGKQAALLAPTTILTQQHFNTFSERLADFPVRVELLNRFRTAKEQKETVSRLKSGEVDVIIGTHRLLSKDVDFRDLGLLIIDEEQRFGVAHKERLKKLRTHVDVLTMSATPIPRTLQFSLAGVRDMSIISTAPNDRLPIHTCIEAWDENIIREAVERERNREGQVFFLHNRVQTINDVAAYLRKLVPAARIATGHGQMERHQLEEVMRDFIGYKIDVLVCTTIIGSGIDIPNANTIIVDRADMFGLSELYQIRGRVGRYKHRAFAYLLVPGDRALTEEAQQRLKALEDFSTLGSGFRIAMRDLEIRGAGDLLGADQSGNIAAVGFETYRDLIAEAVAEVKGEPVRQRNLPAFDLAADAYIPEAYVPAPKQKMTLYRRIANVRSTEEVDELRDEMKDRFGMPPGPVNRLLEIMRVRALGAECAVKAINASPKGITVEFENASVMTGARRGHLKQHFGGAVIFNWQNTPALRYRLNGDKPDLLLEARRFLQVLAES
jgi:transcription-repair coupling factor (superfamily II helicase)